ncbi:TPA: SDR family oxidoreductase [Providencia stuartii]|uniref:SDR family oxidoreductase n=3 Tax=Providencia stuartii TaxID=588 RepID=A0AAJ1N4T0_PROST|nr:MULTISPECIES: SDR family oxidoreductase [Providencia]SST02912.1 Putative short-chain dehydrogenase [Acinetobacter baumannii]AFH95596.1 short chain dehydrogenase [Providencia stuartii MRSN 2154]AIN64223.1 short chain dehydrogenase family protein [Providencia stuartii]AMG66290.1 short chain dehydrogenase [Providencia stuartii]APG49612.1 short chain dehydrogenase [Providencia stuartii]
MNLQLENRVAVVTGGSSGIGLATVRLLLAEGCHVAFCGRNQDKLTEAHHALQAAYPHAKLLAVCCDVLDKTQTEAFAQQVQTHFGQVDLLINNAGQGYVAHYADTPEEAWLQEAQLKLFGVINPVNAFMPLLEQSDIASITCVNSLLARQPEPHMVATSAARAALLNLTLNLSKTLLPKGIRVNSILLGMVESEQWRRRFEARSDKSLDWHSWIGEIAKKRGIPMQRLGKPEEPARALVFLASPMASFTSGAALDVSGGFCHHI